MEKYAYLLIDSFSVILPLALSFLAPSNQKTYLWNIFPAIATVAFFFIIHDSIFTDLGVWGFNYFYLTGIDIFNLPIEEILFFICIPFASLFIHATFIVQKPEWMVSIKISRLTSIIIIILLSFFAFFYKEQIYTLHSFAISAVLIAWSNFKHEKLIRRFYISYLVILIPFLVVNGLLTGSLIDNEIVWYNSQEIIGFRVGTIPIEDFSYGFSLLLSILIFKETFFSAIKK